MANRDLTPEEIAKLAMTRITALTALVDRVLAEVFDATEYTIEDDEAQSFFVAAYARAFRCMLAIRNLAAWPTCDADHALVLTRALVALVARAVWLIDPDDPAERARRFRCWQLSSAIERRTMLRDFDRLGLDFAPSQLEQLDDWIENAQAAGVERLPPDQQLLQQLDLEAFYVRAYRPASDVAHFSLASAAQGFTSGEITLGIVEDREVGFRHKRLDDAEEALVLAMITYGELLQRSEPLFGHGIGNRAGELLRAWMRDYMKNDPADLPADQN